MELENMELSPELMAKVKACRSPEEFFALAQEEGRELSDEELDGIAGGGEWKNECCPTCGHTGTMYCPGTGVSRCGKCGLTW